MKTIAILLATFWFICLSLVLRHVLKTVGISDDWAYYATLAVVPPFWLETVAKIIGGR